MKYIKYLLVAAFMAATVAYKPAQASQRDFNNVVAVVAVAALVKIAVDLEPVHDGGYWEYRDRNEGCYYREVRTTEEVTSCRERGSFYYGGVAYSCVTHTRYNKEYIRSCDAGRPGRYRGR